MFERECMGSMGNPDGLAGPPTNPPDEYSRDAPDETDDAWIDWLEEAEAIASRVSPDIAFDVASYRTYYELDLAPMEAVSTERLEGNRP